MISGGLVQLMADKGCKRWYNLFKSTMPLYLCLYLHNFGFKWLKYVYHIFIYIILVLTVRWLHYQ
jgi:hypothetical protein